jgi:hypothetical protein
MLNVSIMGKEEKKPKRDIDKEYPKWVWVDFKCQDAKFLRRLGSCLQKGWIPSMN